MLLVDDHEADIGERREDGKPRPDDDRHRSRPDPPPFVGSLAITKPRMDERDVRVEVGSQPVDERRGQRDFGDEHEHRTAGLERGGDRLDVDRGLAPTRHALEEERCGIAGDQRGLHRLHGRSLLVAERGIHGSGTTPARRSRGKGPPWPLADLRHGKASPDQPGDRAATVAPGQFRAGQACGRGSGELGEGVPLARAEWASDDGRRIGGCRLPRVGREDPAFETRPGPGRRERPVDRHEPVRFERAEPAEQARAPLRCGEVTGGPRAGGELVEQIDRHEIRAAVVSARRRPLDDQLEPFEHPWREHRAQDEGRRHEVVASDPAGERKGQGWQQRAIGAYPGRQRLGLDALGFGGVAQHDREGLTSAELDDHGLAGFDVHELVRHRVRVRPHATGPRRVDGDLDEAAGPGRDRFGDRGLETELELHH